MIWRRSVSILLLALGWLCEPAIAVDLSADLGLFASAKEVFPPLLADPREIQVSLKATSPVSRTAFGDIGAGDYFGLYRWALPWQDSYVQWSLAGGIFARFDLVSEQKDNEVIDFYAEMPLDARVGKWSLRVMPYHISSHLGDDYIKRTGAVPEKHALDNFKWIAGFEPGKHLRLYAGHTYIIRNVLNNQGHHAVQAGTELTSSWQAGNHLQFYAAFDFQAWSRVEWNPDTNTQLGIRFARKPEDKQNVALFTEYGTGHIPYGQFYQLTETRWTLGLRLNLS